MRTPPRKAKTADASRMPRSAVRVRAQKGHAAPAGRGERHLGAREDQISVTMPPKGDDDEPKQG